MKYQVTLYDKTNKYKPVSALVDVDHITTKEEKAEAVKKGIIKICQKRRWTNNDLKKYGYLTSKIRVYDEQKIKEENEKRYTEIKEQKYASGEWKRPKGDN